MTFIVLLRCCWLAVTIGIGARFVPGRMSPVEEIANSHGALHEAQ